MMPVRRAICCLIACLALVCHAPAPARADDDFEVPPPEKPFSAYPAPAAPDYAKPASWAAWPGRKSAADVVPPGIETPVAANPKADVFFVHPTTYLESTTWNAKFNEGGFTGKQLDMDVLRYQAGVFNACCRIYVPRYRQATLGAFLNPGDDANKSFELAYSDVIRAFDYYVEHENNGRPFILASHSQGSLHATRLLQERILSNPGLRKRLVAAYIVGASLPESIDYTGLPVCENARQTGCILDWNSAASLDVFASTRSEMVTYGASKYQPVGDKNWLCVNPLSWDRTSTSPASGNKASLPIVLEDEELPHVISGITGARCEKGRLLVDIPPAKRVGFDDALTMFGSYHNQDYSLFYASVRQNAIDRVEAFTAH